MQIIYDAHTKRELSLYLLDPCFSILYLLGTLIMLSSLKKGRYCKYTLSVYVGIGVMTNDKRD
jgi:hypothetical protein